MLFSARVVRAAQAFAREKEEKEKHERVRIDANKEPEQAEKALQAATRKGNQAEVETEEKAEKHV